MYWKKLVLEYSILSARNFLINNKFTQFHIFFILFENKKFFYGTQFFYVLKIKFLLNEIVYNDYLQQQFLFKYHVY